MFSRLGFASTDAFIEKDGRQLMVGTLFERFPGEFEFHSYDFFWENYVRGSYYVEPDEVPTAEEILEEYKKQFAERGVEINSQILYAG